MIRSGVLANGVAQVTGLERTNDLTVGIYSYANGLPADTYIVSIDSATQVTLNNVASVTGATSIEFTSASEGVYLDRQGALADVQNIVHERGMMVKVQIRNENQILRDSYGSISERMDSVSFFVKAFPVEMNPSQKQLEKAGIRETQEAVAWMAYKDFTDAGYTPEAFELIRMTVIMNGMQYQVKERGLVSQFADAFLYVTFGLSKS